MFLGISQVTTLPGVEEFLEAGSYRNLLRATVCERANRKKKHLRNIFDKLGVSDRLELALYAIHHRLIDQSSRVLSLRHGLNRPILFGPHGAVGLTCMGSWCGTGVSPTFAGATGPGFESPCDS